MTPATTIPLSLPWITGDPASLYWRVRAVSGGSVSAWSDAQPFTMRWSSVPSEWRPESGSPADMPGYVRWHPVEGATGYQVWFVNADKVISTITNVADEREYYTFHDKPEWTGAVKWRVRAIRRVYGKTSDKLPVVSHGPWSPEYTWTNTSDPLTPGTDVQPVAAVSDRVSTPARPDVHSLMPAFLFAGNGDTDEGCTGCTSSVTATASTPSTGARSSAVPPTRRAPAGRSPSPERRGARKARGAFLGTARKATRSLSTRLRSRRRRPLPMLLARPRRPPPATSLRRRTRTPRPVERRSTSGIATASWAAVTTPPSSRSRSSTGRQVDTARPSCRRTRARAARSQARPRVWQEERQTPRRSRRRSGCRPPGDCSWGRRARPRSTGLRS